MADNAAMRNDERTWEVMREALLAGARGDDVRPFASKRTLFGIRSSVEERMDAIADEFQRERDQQKRE